MHLEQLCKLCADLLVLQREDRHRVQLRLLDMWLEWVRRLREVSRLTVQRREQIWKHIEELVVWQLRIACSKGRRQDNGWKKQNCVVADAGVAIVE